jgi:drug/metabolite transporter (DMT)-like permease
MAHTAATAKSGGRAQWHGHRRGPESPERQGAGRGPQGATGAVARHGKAVWVVPLLTGVAFGLYASFLQHTNGVSAVSATLMGVWVGLGMLLLTFLAALAERRLQREARAISWGVVIGAGVGTLFILADYSVLKAVTRGLAVGACAGAAAFYWFYTHEN